MKFQPMFQFFSVIFYMNFVRKIAVWHSVVCSSK